MNRHLKEGVKGIWKENPIFVIMLGMCPTLAVTTSVSNALGMGCGVIFVLTLSNVFISLLRKIIPEEVRIPCYIVIIASFVTILEMVMHAFLPSLYKALGIYLSLIVVNCIILGRAEAFASKNSVLDSALDGLGMGFGFMLGLVIISLIREVLGNGTITLLPLFSWDGKITLPLISKSPVRVISLSAGALLVMGLLRAFIAWRREKKK